MENRKELLFEAIIRIKWNGLKKDFDFSFVFEKSDKKY